MINFKQVNLQTSLDALDYSRNKDIVHNVCKTLITIRL